MTWLDSDCCSSVASRYGGRACHGQEGVCMTKPKAAIFWSGGRDCCLAVLRAWHSFDLVTMVTMFSLADLIKTSFLRSLRGESSTQQRLA